MENILQPTDCVCDFETLSKDDFKDGIRIKVYSEINDLLAYNSQNSDMCDSTIFGVWVEIGKSRAIMANVSIDELELFSKSILTHIEILRRNYGEQIKVQTDRGNNI